jgi:broad specificity phosphatase PhoE
VTRLVLCRHGEPDSSAAGRFCGRFDPPLSPAGRAQADALAAALTDPVAVYSSPARRTLETAACLSPDPTVDDDLRELDFGEADGLRYEDVAARWPQLYDEWLEAPTRVTFPGGEGFGVFRARLLGALDRIAPPALIVTHGGVIRTALAHWLSIPDEALFRIEVSYGAVSVVEWQDGTPVVRVVNGPPASLAPGA